MERERGTENVIEVVYEEKDRRSAAYEGGTLIGECDYEENGAVWTAYHTEVDPAYGGQGIAGRLVAAVAAAARERGAKIVPQCSYVRRLFETKPEYADVNAEKA